jgi:hypothetical protein
MSFEQQLKELMMPASTLSPTSVEEYKSNIKSEKKSNKVFPSDEEIDKVVESADEAFWQTVVKYFSNQIEDTEFTPSKELETFKKQQKEAIKNWLKPKFENVEENKPESKHIEKGGMESFEPPASNLPATGEVRI